MRAISAIIPKAQSEKQGLLFKEWIPLALIEPEWLNLINAYFESCKTTDEDKEDAENAENTNSAGNKHMENNGGEKEDTPHAHTCTNTSTSTTSTNIASSCRTLDTINCIRKVIINIL